MKRYGLRIGYIGIEFPSVEDRDKALKSFTKGVDVKISDSGIRFSDGEGSFSVYDRDSKEILTNCHLCHGVFGLETCSKREYPYKNSWEKKFGKEENFICDACLVSQQKAEKVFKAKQTLEKEEDD